MEKRFITVVTCMDGRIQNAVNHYMQIRFKALYVDTITEAGPCKLIVENSNPCIVENIKNRLEISTKKHGSKVVGVVGHFDCAVILDSDIKQKQLILKAASIIKKWFDDVEVIPLWVNENLEVEVIK